MIELFDPARLAQRRDRSGVAMLALLAIGVGGLAVYAASLHQQLREVQAQQQQAQNTLRQAKAIAPPNAALLQDLQRQTHALQLHVAQFGGHEAASALQASHWLERIASLGSSDVSLSRIDIDRAGSARIEGLANSPQAVSRFVQAWATQDQLAGVPARALEVRQDKGSAPHLRFVMQATTPRGQPAKAQPPQAAASASTKGTT